MFPPSLLDCLQRPLEPPRHTGMAGTPGAGRRHHDRQDALWPTGHRDETPAVAGAPAAGKAAGISTGTPTGTTSWVAAQCTKASPIIRATAGCGRWADQILPIRADFLMDQSLV